MKFLDIFAGIGSTRRGLESAGHQCVGYIEWDKWARKSYEAIFDTKGEWTASDVREARADELPDADIWTFGFPCQDLSVAGKQAGFNGNRSSLFFTVIGLIRELPEDSRPEWLIAENVMGFFSSNRGYDFLAAQIALDEIGYDVEWEVFNATQFGIPQNRQRVFLVGHSRNRGRREVFPLRIDDSKVTEASRNIRSENEVIGFETAFGNSNGSPVFTDTMRCLDGAQSKGVIVYHYHSKDCTFREFTDVAPTLTGYIGTGGNNVPLVEGQRSQTLVSYNRKDGVGTELDEALTLNASDWRGLNRNQTQNAVVQRVGNTNPSGHGMNGNVYDADGLLPTITTNKGEGHKMLVGTRIRKLTPLECWRLMGREDCEFHAARNAGVSDTQLYKQAGNSLIPQIVQAIGERIAVLSAN